MRVLLSILLLWSVTANAADWITATIHVSTNAPLGNTNSITINGDTRTFTNSVTGSPATLVQETNSIPYTATNLLNHLTLYKVNPGYYLSQTASTNVTIRGAVGGPMAVTLAGGWGHVTYSTQTVSTPTIVVRVPISSEAASNQTWIASQLASSISGLSTSAFATNAAAVSNLVHKGAGIRQRVYTELEVQNILAAAFAQLTNANLVNATNRGYVVALTNGYWTNGTLSFPIATNLVNRGGAISSPGTNGIGSEQFGTGARATNESSLAVGRDAVALGPFSTAIGNEAEANEHGDSALGYAAVVTAGNGLAVGAGAVTTGTNGTAVGTLSTVTHANSTAIGFEVESSASNQVAIGNSSATVLVAGMLSAASQTNSVLRGTNVINGRLDFTSRANTGLANGNNSGVILGTNVYIRLSGATTIAAIAGFAAEQDGSWHIVQISGSVTNTILNESGVDATAANRILTGTGGDVSFTNSPTILYMHYDATALRWRLRMDR